jgi:tetrachlorobenzoquinone reductase
MARCEGYRLVLAKSKREFWIEEGQTILDTLIDADIKVSYSCEEGMCGVCETKVISGVPVHRDTVFTEEMHQRNGTMMICVSGCLTEELVLDI